MVRDVAIENDGLNVAASKGYIMAGATKYCTRFFSWLIYILLNLHTLGQ